MQDVLKCWALHTSICELVHVIPALYQAFHGSLIAVFSVFMGTKHIL